MRQQKSISNPGGIKPPSLPVYHQIARLIHARIYHGIYEAGNAIPTEYELGEEFGVSRLTVRQAIRELSDQGMVVSRRGSGTFVVEEPRTVPPVNFIGYLEDFILQGTTMQMTMEHMAEVQPPAFVRDALGLDAEENVVVVERVGRNRSVPINYVRIYLPLPIASLVQPEEYEQGSLMPVLIHHGISITHAQQSISAASVVSPISDLLELAEQAPVIFSTIVVFADTSPVYVAEVYYRPDRTIFTSSLATIPNVQPALKRGTNSYLQPQRTLE